MSAGFVNLLALVGIVAILASVVAVFVIAATRQGGRKARGLAKPSRASQRQVNPKTGTLFP